MSLDIKQYYVSKEEVTVELERRWNDRALRSKVEDFLGSDIPKALITADGPSAVSVRCIATPDNEFLNFFHEAHELALKPVFLEYTKDKFVAKNEDKYCLCKLHFLKEGVTALNQCPAIKVVDFNTMEGKQFADIETLWGEKLVDFHHGILKEKLGDAFLQLEIEDFSDWFNCTRLATEYYYLYYLSLFICHGVLYENLLMSDDEREFTEAKILPSIHRIEELFGVRPLIRPITPVESEDDFTWWTYPEDVKLIVDNRIAGFSR